MPLHAVNCQPWLAAAVCHLYSLNHVSVLRLGFEKHHAGRRIDHRVRRAHHRHEIFRRADLGLQAGGGQRKSLTGIVGGKSLKLGLHHRAHIFFIGRRNCCTSVAVQSRGQRHKGQQKGESEKKWVHHNFRIDGGVGGFPVIMPHSGAAR